MLELSSGVWNIVQSRTSSYAHRMWWQGMALGTVAVIHEEALGKASWNVELQTRANSFQGWVCPDSCGSIARGSIDVFGGGTGKDSVPHWPRTAELSISHMHCDSYDHITASVVTKSAVHHPPFEPRSGLVCLGTLESGGCSLSPAAAEEEGAQVADKGKGWGVSCCEWSDHCSGQCSFSGDWNHVPPSSGDGYRVLQTVGVHPRLATDPTAWSQVKHLIEKPECVSIGECGLDAIALSTKDPKNTMMQQEELVQKHAELAIATGKPLVLHIRGKGQKSNQALYRRMFTLLQEAGLGKQHRVYVHCFTGSLGDALSWRSAFPRVFFGISWASTRTTDFESVGRLIPLDHLALESDAPHLSPGRVKSTGLSGSGTRQ